MSILLRAVPKSPKAALQIALLAILAACAHNRALDIDPDHGYFAKDAGAPPSLSDDAVRASEDFDIDSRRALIVVPPKVGIYAVQAGDDFIEQAIGRIDYFGVVMNTDELKATLSANSIDTPALQAAMRAGDEAALMRAAAEAYQPFLWLRLGHKRYSRAPRDERYQLILTDALTLEDIFIVETPYQYALGHSNVPAKRLVSHDKNHYPMLNALIDYIRSHSRAYPEPSD